MARVARRAGQRGRTIPAPPRPGCGRPEVTLDSHRSRFRRPDVDTGVRSHRPGAAGRVPGEGSRSGATDSGSDRRGSAGVPGRVQRETTAGGGRQDAGDDRRPPAAGDRSRLADGSADVSPVDPLEISVTDGELGRRHRRRRRRRRGRRRRSPRLRTTPGTEVWTPEDPLAYGTSYTLTATATNADDEEAKATTTFTTVTPATVVDAVDRPARRHDRRRRHADPRLLRRPGRRQGRRREPPAGHQLHPDRRRVELGERLRGALPAVAVLAGRTPRSRSTPTSTASTSATGIWGEKNRTVSFSDRRPGTSPSPTPAPTRCTSTTATSSCRPTR